MIKKGGKVFVQVAELLMARGRDISTLAIATLGRGTDHVVMLNGEAVGDYNHRSKSLTLYSDHIPTGQKD